MSDFDLVIVGAGAAGGAIARELANSGLRILCLEQGDFPKVNQYPSTGSDWEIIKNTSSHVSPNVRKLSADYPINDAESPISIANFNAVGGSTVLFSGHFPRLHPSDFRVKTLDGVADDWPISYKDLEPYYEKNSTYVAVSGLEGDPAYPQIKHLQPPVPIGKMSEKLATGFNKLQWHWWPSYSAIATKEFNNQNACINLGPCNTGCPQGAKSSSDVTYWTQDVLKKVTLSTNSRVKDVAVDSSGNVTGVNYFDVDGNVVFVSAKRVVLACNGVGTPRLLLNSKSPKHPNGLGNSSGFVGKNLMLHPVGYVEGFFEEHLSSNIGPQGCAIFSQEFYETDESRGFKRGYTMQVLRGPGVLESVQSLVARRKIGWGASHYKDFAELHNHSAHISVIVEDLPEFNNRVELDPHLKDSNGIPAPKIFYELGENSRSMLAHGLQKGRELMLAAGATKTSAFGPVRDTGWHLMGTARMGNDPRNSVVNGWGVSHDCNNLYIADSSVFVTSGGVNPAATIEAFALRVAERILEDSRSNGGLV